MVLRNYSWKVGVFVGYSRISNEVSPKIILHYSVPIPMCVAHDMNRDELLKKMNITKPRAFLNSVLIELFSIIFFQIFFYHLFNIKYVSWWKNWPKSSKKRRSGLCSSLNILNAKSYHIWMKELGDQRHFRGNLLIHIKGGRSA